MEMRPDPAGTAGVRRRSRGWGEALERAQERHQVAALLITQRRAGTGSGARRSGRPRPACGRYHRGSGLACRQRTELRGTVNPPMSAHLPVSRASPGSLVFSIRARLVQRVIVDVLLSPVSSRCSPGTKLLFAVGASAAASWGQRGGRSHHDHDVGDALGRPPVNFHSELATPSVPWGTSLRPRRNS